MEFSLPRATLQNSGLAKCIGAENDFAVPSGAIRIPPEDVESLRLRAAFTPRGPASSRLPFSYQRIPRAVRSLVGRAIGRWRRRQVARWAAFPKWPLDLSADFLADLAGAAGAPLSGSGATPVVLTHDLDSNEGLMDLDKWFLDMEEQVGARSTSFIVPEGGPFSHDLLASVRARGHEIGIHGCDHSNRTPFVDPQARRRRLEAASELIARYGIAGYRSPSLLRTRELLQDLGRFYAFDSSIPTSGGLFPTPNNGCASARPFMVAGIIELPVSMPRDGSLLFLGHSPPEILRIWTACAETIARSGGVVVLLTHCEDRFSGRPDMRDVYRRFLEHVSLSPEFVWETTSSIVNRIRDGRHR